MPTYQPASAETVQRRLRWAAQKLAHRASPTVQPPPDHSLLAHDPGLCHDASARAHLNRLVAHRPVKQALLIEDGERTLIGLRIRDHEKRHHDELRTPRRVDPEGWFILDIASWYGGSFVLNRVTVQIPTKPAGYSDFKPASIPT